MNIENSAPTVAPKYPHFWLYCKRHYQDSDNEWEDLRKVAAHYSGLDLKYVTKDIVLQLLASAAEEAILLCYNNPLRALFNEMNGVKHYNDLDVLFLRQPLMTVEDFLRRVYRNIIMMAECKGKIILPEPDPTCLPIREKE